MADTDIVIIGGGVAGLTVAKGLIEHSGHSVAVVDSKLEAKANKPVDFDTRVIALAQRSVDELTAWGVSLPGSVAIQHIEVSDKGAAGLCELSARKFGLTAFGEVVAIQKLGESLFASIKDTRLQRIRATVTDVTSHNDYYELKLNDDTRLRSKLVILADGGRSEISGKLGFHYKESSYQQTAIIANVKTSESHGHKAFERFTSSGPLAFLPFTTSPQEDMQNEYSVVWTVSDEQASSLMALSDSEFIQQLQKAFGYRKGRILAVGKKETFALSLRVSDRLMHHRSVVIGNAAQTLHPIAGQGFNLGVRDAVTLVNTLKTVADPGEFSALYRYQQARKPDRTVTIGLTDSLVTLFSNQLLPLQAARNIGLLGMNNSYVLQSQFVRQTTGFG